MKITNLMNQFSLLIKGRIQLLERLVIPAEAEPAPHLMRGIQFFSGSLFSQGQVWIPVFTGMTTWLKQQRNLFKELKGLSFLRKQESRSCSFVLKNSKGISVLFLVIAMLLMVTIGYVFSYLIPMKQKTVEFPIYSTQAFFIAQSGIEYAIRYSSNQDWRDTTALAGLDGVQQNIVIGKVNGRFTIRYSPDTLTSTGVIINSSERRIVKVSNLSQFLNVLILDPVSAVPCWCWQTQRVRFYIKYTGTNSVTLTAFSATWQETVGRRLRQIYMDGILKYDAPGGLYYNDNPRQNFNAGGGSQTINPGVIPIIIRWSGNISDTNTITIKFYTALGDPYTFTLNLSPSPGGDCAAGC